LLLAAIVRNDSMIPAAHPDSLLIRAARLPDETV
jgi:hypothetical protein